MNKYEKAVEEADAAKWWETYDNIVQLAQHMANTHVDANVIVHMLERPWSYTDQWVECLDLAEEMS